MCQLIFDRVNNLKAHTKTCCTDQNEIYIGGKYKRDKTLFERLELAGYDVTRDDRYYEYVSCFDFEALQVPRSEKLKGREIHYKHVPVTFSVHSNIPGHTDVQHRVSNGNPQKLVDELITILLLHQQSASTEMRRKYEVVFKQLEEDLLSLETPGDSEEQQKYKQKCQKKLQTLQCSLEKYCNQHVVLSFNGSRYDLPLIKRYLPSSLKLLDELPSHIINKDQSYMVVATGRLKFLDVTNYLAAGTSLAAFYKAYDVKNPKACFPYQWLDSLDKLEARFLPEREHFYNLLTNRNVTDEEYQDAVDAWCLHDWETFGQYVEYYNNLDVIGMTEAVGKMFKVYKEKDLDLFKEAFSLAGITQKYVFKNLPEDVYFSQFSEEHAHIYKEFRTKGICGGPSIVFTRYHEAGVTKIRGGSETCRRVLGLDCNSMYLKCTAMPMSTGWYNLREKKDGYKKQSRYSKEAIQWMEQVAKERNIAIRHEENSPLGERRIQNFKVDGICEEIQTIFEYHGCYHHGHDCGNNYNPKKWEKTLEKEEALRNLGYNVETITSCQWHLDPRSKIWYLTEDVSCTMEDIISGVTSDEIFGYIKLSIRVPDELVSKYSEFPPIFKNVEIKLEDIGETMQKFCKDIKRTSGVKRSLISSMFGDGIVISTPLMKKYLEMGLIIDDIEWVLDYHPVPCFKWFQDDVIRDRRRADLDKNYAILGDCSKTMGNAFYGGTLIDRSKHTSVNIVDEARVHNHIKNPLFKTMLELNDRFFEVEKTKKSVRHSTPIQVGISVYSYAKLLLISFWEFLNKYLVTEKYEIMYCDTDSVYLALSENTLDACVKPELLEDWKREKDNFLSSSDLTPIDFEGQTVSFKQYDKRTPGKFKAEFEGLGMVCLNSKVVHAWGVDKEQKPTHKTSCKGSNKRRNLFGKEHFLSVLETRIPHQVKNAGFVKDNLTIKTYTQTKQGLAFFYGKRKILEDGISTVHLDI